MCFSPGARVQVGRVLLAHHGALSLETAETATLRGHLTMSLLRAARCPGRRFWPTGHLDSTDPKACSCLKLRNQGLKSIQVPATGLRWEIFRWTWQPSSAAHYKKSSANLVSGTGSSIGMYRYMNESTGLAVREARAFSRANEIRFGAQTFCTAGPRRCQSCHSYSLLQRG